MNYIATGGPEQRGHVDLGACKIAVTPCDCCEPETLRFRRVRVNCTALYSLRKSRRVMLEVTVGM